jgi:PEP-CTERM motif
MLALILFLMATFSASLAYADLLVYEGFDYAPGSLAGQNGGFGFASAWTAGEIVAGSLSYTDGNSNGLPTSGNRALISGTSGSLSSYRDLSRNYGADTNFGPGTYWASFIGERLEPHATLDENSARSYGFQLHNGTGTSGDERLSAGSVTNTPPGVPTTWSFFSDGSGALLAPTTAPMHDLSFVVMQINIADATDGNNSDSAAMWVNPNLDEALGAPDAELASGAGNNFDYLFERIRLWAGNTSGGNPYAEWTIDEIRIGTTFEDVIGATFLLGDTDGDGVVEPDDLNPIRANYRQEVNLRSDGDLTGDLFVDLADFRQWKTAILAGGGSLANIDLRFLSVPEPSTGCLLLFGLGAIGGARSRRIGFGL